MLCPVSSTPLGVPVVPPVPAIITTSSTGSACQGSSLTPASQSAKRDRPRTLPLPAGAVEADQGGELGQVRRDLGDQRRERGGEDQAAAVEQVEQLAVLGRLVARVDRAPDRAGPADAEHAAEGDRVVAGQDRDLVARPDARPGQRPGRPTRTGAAPRA